MLTCQGISYQYESGAIALKNVHFSTDNKGIIGVIGSNGAGKSTLFKCLTGLVKPTSGAVYYQGQPLKYDKKHLAQLRQRVNVVQQDPEKQIFFPRVFDDVAFGPRNLKWSQAAVAETVAENLEKMNLTDLQDRPVHHLSYGQKKRTAIAGIMAMKCDMMILDEPEAGLDPQMKHQMIALLKGLKQDGMTIIVSSHNMDLMLTLCDYVYVLHEGHLILEGDTLSVLQNEAVLKEARLEMPTLFQLAKTLNLTPLQEAGEWTLKPNDMGRPL